MDWSSPIDSYCERTDATLWSEPLNAVSNLAFLIAAVAAARRAGTDRPVLAFAMLIAVIGIGSFLFHTFANKWSVLADVIPIAIFIYGYFYLVMRRFLGLAWPVALLAVLAFLVGSQAVEAMFPPGFLNGSGGYLPPWGAMFAIGGVLLLRGAPGAGLILAAGGVFTLSLTFRSIDHAVCAAWPVGVHYLWHVLNALTLYLLLAAALRHRSARLSPATA